MSTSPNLVHNVRFDNIRWFQAPTTIEIHGPADLPLALQRRAGLEHLVKQGLPLEGLALAGFDLTGAELRGAIFKDCDLNGTDFTAADLTDAKLTDVRARGAKFDHSDLTGAILESVDFLGSSMAAAILKDSVIQGCSLIRTDLSRIDGDGLTLVNVKTNDQTIWTDAAIVWSDLSRMGSQADGVIDRALSADSDRAACRAFQRAACNPSLTRTDRQREAQQYAQRVAANT